jgi:flagellar biosynthesis chaperone FliJ
MARFIFKLEAVLEQRSAIERDKKLAVAVLERERLAIEDAIRACQRGIVKEKEEWRLRLSGVHARGPGASGEPAGVGGMAGVGGVGKVGGAGLDVRAIRLQASTTGQLNAKAQQEVLRLAGVHKRLEAARCELLEATTRRKAVELLKARRFQEWKDALARRENAELDELAVMRRGGGGGRGDDADAGAQGAGGEA